MTRGGTGRSGNAASDERWPLPRPIDVGRAADGVKAAARRSGTGEAVEHSPPGSDAEQPCHTPRAERRLSALRR
jgi:hypothetical protein